MYVYIYIYKQSNTPSPPPRWSLFVSLIVDRSDGAESPNHRIYRGDFRDLVSRTISALGVSQI